MKCCSLDAPRDVVPLPITVYCGHPSSIARTAVHIIETGVRDFINLAMKSGGLKPLFSPRMRAEIGQAVHAEVRLRRPEGYQREVGIAHAFQWRGYRLIVRGRIDGVLSDDGKVQIEEIKSTCLPFDLLSADSYPYHVAQLQLYHHFASERFSDRRVIPTLTYVNPVTFGERSFTYSWSAEESRDFFERLARQLIQQQLDARAWQHRRDRSIRTLSFPFTDMRLGQAHLLHAVEEAIAAPYDLLIEAATGIGKTMGILYPAIRHLMRNRSYSRIFYLTAKSAGADVVRESMAALREQGLHLRVLYLQAKERICPYDKVDRPECMQGECPYADEFYEKVGDVVELLLPVEDMTADLIATAARDHQVCPFELELELATHADLIVCDYNYAFDPFVSLKRFFACDQTASCLFLVDEAHNLVTRGREIHSATLDTDTLAQLKLLCVEEHALCTAADDLVAHLTSWREQLDLEGAGALGISQVPDDFALHLKSVLELLGWHLMIMPRGIRRRQVMDLYFDLLHFDRVSGSISPEYVLYVSRRRKSTTLHLQCVNPGLLLRQYLHASTAAVFFSATLSPPRYFQELLGMRDGHRHCLLPTPFPPENRLYLHVSGVSTRYRSREATKMTVAEVILNTVRVQPGNYLAFFPSFDYQATVWAEMMLTKSADIHIMTQSPGMTIEQQDTFLHQACATGEAHANLGLAVMGGLFGEAIDLPGDKLIGAFILGPGLPSVTLEQETIQGYFDEVQPGSGFLYAYVIPGMIRVVQAAGRVFRTPSDRGVVLLMDDRFLEDPYRELLPADWVQAGSEFSTANYLESVQQFWRESQDNDA